MQLVKWNPMRDMLGLNGRYDNMFDDFFNPTRGTRLSREWNWNPKVDIYEEDGAIVVKAELPGVEKDNIVVDVKNGILTLKGERASDKEVKEDSYYRRERVFGSFERRFNLPENVDPEKITADYKDGVLKVGIPKPEEALPKQITVH
ncbi:MAG: Hsp20/alpha crystallin family protein [Deltaproteobacteria bacterium]|nr:Hsp20/alpha crystallin family protein [Deltaproteobacteria bacterium]